MGGFSVFSASLLFSQYFSPVLSLHSWKRSNGSQQDLLLSAETSVFVFFLADSCCFSLALTVFTELKTGWWCSPYWCDALALLFLLFGGVVEVCSAVAFLQHLLEDRRPFDLASCQQRVYKAGAGAISLEKCFLGSCKSLRGAAGRLSSPHCKRWSSWHPLSTASSHRFSVEICSKSPDIRGASSQLWLLPCNAGSRAECWKQPLLGNRARNLNWNLHCAGEGFSPALTAWLKKPSSARHAVTVYLLSWCLETALTDADFYCDWNCVNIWYLQHPPFPFSHPLLCAECNTWNNRKHLRVGRR